MKIRSCFVSNSSSSSFICSFPNYDKDSNPMKIQYYYDILDCETDEKERQKLLDKVRYWEKYCQDNDCVVFDLNVDYGCDDVLDSLEQKLKGFSVIKVLDE